MEALPVLALSALPCPGPGPRAQVAVVHSLSEGKVRAAKVGELFVYDNFSRVAVDEVAAGDICALTGITDIMVGGADPRERCTRAATNTLRTPTAPPPLTTTHARARAVPPQIGETIAQKESPVALPTINVEEPTVTMVFKVREELQQRVTGQSLVHGADDEARLPQTDRHIIGNATKTTTNV